MGFTYNKGQLKVSSDPQHEIRIWVNENKDEIIRLYKETLSVNYIIKKTELFQKENRPIWGKNANRNCDKGQPISIYNIRPYIEEMLINENLYVSHRESVIEGHKRARQKLFEKEGIVNVSQRNNGSGWCKMNDIERNKVKFFEDFLNYREEVNRLTKRNKQRLLRGTFPGWENYTLPKYCEFTGIKFSDADSKNVNPNDFLKRSLDHRESVLMCYMKGWSVEECADPSNFAFVLKQCNSLKGNVSYNEFMEVFAPKIRKELINEGYEYKET